MSYAHDPYWAHKQGWDPDRRQAYENQVMADRAAAEQHRTEFDAGAIITSGLLFGTIFMGRAARKSMKARQRWTSEHCPVNYSARSAELRSATSRLEADSQRAISGLTVEIATLEGRLPQAGNDKSARTLQAKLAALQATLNGQRLAFTQTLEALRIGYLDIVEYEEGLAQLS